VKPCHYSPYPCCKDDVATCESGKWAIAKGTCQDPTCPGTPPDPLGGYFEGDFTDIGDSLVLRDATDTVSFRNITDSAFTFVVNGIAFPMRRN